MKKMQHVGTILALSLGAFSLSGCGAPGSGFENPFTVPLVMTIAPNPVSIEQGKTSHVAVSVKTAQGLAVASSITAQSVNGITVSTDSGGLGITVAPETAPGTYGVTVSAKAGAGNATEVLSVTVTEPKAETPGEGQ